MTPTEIARADRLPARLNDEAVELAPLEQKHREPLRAACTADPSIWDIYLVNYRGDAFDLSFDALLDGSDCAVFAAYADGLLVGMSGYLYIAARHRALEIGHTYLVPAVRGTGVNRRFKQLLIDHAFACGFHRIEFRVDLRNARSMAAMAKLGAAREGTLRDHLMTWNGHVRSSTVYSILRGEWAGASC